jgi:hypothetical protein
MDTLPLTTVNNRVKPIFFIDEEMGRPYTKDNEDYESPMKALAFNFRFNQIFGIFPGRISSDWNDFIIVRKMILLTFGVKALFITTILALVNMWLTEQVIQT